MIKRLVSGVRSGLRRVKFGLLAVYSKAASNDTLTRIIRTTAAYVWAFVALRVSEWFGITFSTEQSAVILQGLELFLGAFIYAFVAVLGKHFPWLERILLIPIVPTYTKKPVNDSNSDSGA